VSDSPTSVTPFDSANLQAPINPGGVPGAPFSPGYQSRELEAAWHEQENRYSGGVVRQTLNMMRRRRKVILATLLTFLLATLIFLMLTPRVYEAVATLQVHTAPVVSGDNDNSDLPVLADLSGATQSRSLETQLAILRSAPIRDKAVANLSPGAKAQAQKYYQTEIAAVGDTDLITLTSRTYDPYASAAISNEFCKEYIRLSLSKNRGQLQSATSYVGQQLNTARAGLVKARDALRNYKQSSGVFDLPAESQNLLTEVGQIDSQWRDARATKAAQLAELTKLRQIASRMPTARVVPQEIVRRPAVETMKAQLTKLELDRLAALEEYQASRPEVQAIEGQIRAIRQRLRNEAQTEVGSWVNEVNPVRQNLVQSIATLQGQVWATEARGTALKAASIRARRQLAALPEREQRLGQLTTELTAQQERYQMLNQKYQSLRMTQDARVANASILFPAVPGQSVSGSKARTILFALLLGLIVATGLAALLDWMDDRVYTERDARAVSRLPVLAQIPYSDEQARDTLLQTSVDTVAAKGMGGGVAQAASLQAITDNPVLLESFRMARTRFALAAGGKPVNSVLITSSRPGEGKSVTAVNLAIAAAMSGEKVIIVDADLREPAIHRLLLLPNLVGFSDVIQHKSTLAEALQPTTVPNLFVLTSGTQYPNSFQLLNSLAARSCLQEATEQADLVVVDSPSALLLADAQILSTMTDATLLVISTQDAGRQDIMRTREMLSHNNGHLLGVILNKVDSVKSI
jgi:capsular exopolysaccharide synthesis family protein